MLHIIYRKSCVVERFSRWPRSGHDCACSLSLTAPSQSHIENYRWSIHPFTSVATSLSQVSRSTQIESLLHCTRAKGPRVFGKPCFNSAWHQPSWMNLQQTFMGESSDRKKMPIPSYPFLTKRKSMAAAVKATNSKIFLQSLEHDGDQLWTLHCSSCLVVKWICRDESWHSTRSS